MCFLSCMYNDFSPRLLRPRIKATLTVWFPDAGSLKACLIGVGWSITRPSGVVSLTAAKSNKFTESKSQQRHQTRKPSRIQTSSACSKAPAISSSADHGYPDIPGQLKPRSSQHDDFLHGRLLQQRIWWSFKPRWAMGLQKWSMKGTTKIVYVILYLGAKWCASWELMILTHVNMFYGSISWWTWVKLGLAPSHHVPHWLHDIKPIPKDQHGVFRIFRVTKIGSGLPNPFYWPCGFEVLNLQKQQALRMLAALMDQAWPLKDGTALVATFIGPRHLNRYKMPCMFHCMHDCHDCHDRSWLPWLQLATKR